MDFKVPLTLGCHEIAENPGNSRICLLGKVLLIHGAPTPFFADGTKLGKKRLG